MLHFYLGLTCALSGLSLGFVVYLLALIEEPR